MRVAIIITIGIVIVIGLACRIPKTSEIAAEAVVYVTDDAKVIDEASRTQLETRLAALKARKRIDFSVVTVRTTDHQSAFDYSLALARERKNNSHEQNVSGLLLLVAVDDRNWHIQISKNLEDDLPNELLTNLSTPMTDLFKEKRYGEGIIKYVDAVIAELDRKIAATESTKNTKNS